MKQKRITKNVYFMNLAKLVAERSSCLSRKVGCVLVDANDNVIATGYNGPPRGQDHCSTCIRKEYDDIHKCRAVHAEQNALLQCKDTNTIKKAYVTASPCNTCLKLFLNTSCEEIIYLEEYRKENDFIFEHYDLSKLNMRKYDERE